MTTSEGNTTAPGSLGEHALASPRVDADWTLTVAWSDEEPHRVGQSCAVRIAHGSALLLGRARGKTPESQLRAPLIRFSIVRPGSTIDCGPLGGDRMSQEQALLRYTAIGIDLEHIGRAPLLVNGELLQPGARRVLQAGDALFVPRHSVLLVTKAPATLAADPLVDASQPYGEPDAHRMVGESLAMWDLRRQIALAHRVGAHTFLYGCTGTGKELVARALHDLSGRKGRFVAVNCATLVATLAESQLFGNLANYPNKGDEERRGYLGEADGGTLFLDEIGELSLELQAKLLRVLQADGEYRRLGAAQSQRANVLVVAATNRDLAHIKHDLLPRFPSRIEVPPLSVRIQDLPLLARAFVLTLHREKSPLATRFVGVRPDGAAHVRMSPYVVTAMLRRPYAGNVRDLENYVRLAMAESLGEEITPPADVRPWRAPASVPPAAPPPSPDETLRDGVPAIADEEPAPRDPRTLSEAEIRDMLATLQGAVVPAAKRLGVSRDQLRRRMEKLGIDPRPYRQGGRDDADEGNEDNATLGRPADR